MRETEQIKTKRSAVAVSYYNTTNIKHLDTVAT